jgi:molybdenum cofactor biosynthesis enzyme MoaA
MYGHIPDYLNAEALRLRAERAEHQAGRWRVTAYVLLVLLIAQTWLVVDTAMELQHVRQGAAKQADQVAVWTEQTADLNQGLRAERRRAEGELQACVEQWEAIDMPTVLCSQQAADVDDARLAAERNFKVCLAANAGLVEVLQEFDRTVKDQKLLINDAVEMAKRCEAKPTTWVARVPAASEVIR